MPCLVCFLRKFHRSELIGPGQLSTFSAGLAEELEDSRRFSLNSLMALLAILAISGSRLLQPAALTLLAYTINLRLATSACFLHNHPTWSRFLHVIPPLGTFSMAIVELITSAQSPALTAASVLLGILPFLTIAVHHGTQCVEASTARLSVQMQDLPVPVTSGSADTTTPSH